jgi:hypothetical protein
MGFQHNICKKKMLISKISLSGSMVTRPKIGFKQKIQQLWYHLKNADKMSILLPIAIILLLYLSFIFNSRHIPQFVPYNSSLDELSIYSINLSRDYLERITLGLMTTCFGAYMVNYIIKANDAKKERRNRIIKAYRGVYSLVAIVIEAAIHQFLLNGMNPSDNPYFTQLRSIHYSHEMIDPVLSHRIPPHNSTDDMADIVNVISDKLLSNDPVLTKTWHLYYQNFKQEIMGQMGQEKKEIIDSSIYEAINLYDNKGIVGVINHFSTMTKYILSGRWDHFAPEESIKHIEGYLKEAIELARLLSSDADLIKVKFENI